jgi:hypothetical protein
MNNTEPTGDTSMKPVLDLSWESTLDSPEVIIERRDAVVDYYPSNVKKLETVFKIMHLDNIQSYRSEQILQGFSSLIGSIADFESDSFQSVMYLSSLEFNIERFISNIKDHKSLDTFLGRMHSMIGNCGGITVMRNDWNRVHNINDPMFSHFYKGMLGLSKRVQDIIQAHKIKLES